MSNYYDKDKARKKEKVSRAKKRVVKKLRSRIVYLEGDYKYNSHLVNKFINHLMHKGKKSLALRIFYKALDSIAEKVEDEKSIDVFLKAVENVKPNMEVKSHRVGGATYQVPFEIKESRREALAIRWILNSVRAKKGKKIFEKLTQELLDAYNLTGVAFKRKEDMHRMAEANEAFAYYRFY